MSQVLCEWGIAGAHALAPRAAVIVVVDVLSFSTCVDVAVGRGAHVYPFRFGDPLAAMALALKIGGAVAGPRGDPAFHFSLSPATLDAIPSGTKLVLPSPNGSAISAAVGDVPLLAGCLRNARAVAAKAVELARGGDIVVIPAGEHWPGGSFRPAIEDLLGAGAVLDHIDATLSPEAEVARDAYRAGRPHLGRLIRDSVSGQELIGRRYPQDVETALLLDASGAVPVLRNGAFINAATAP